MRSNADVYLRHDDSHVVTERLADGSVAVFDSNQGAVHSLNPSAALVWECCAEPMTAAQIVQLLRDDARAPVNEALVIDALRQLERARLVLRRPGRGGLLSHSRREALKQIAWTSAGAAALPVVLTLTAAEQHLHAQGPGSTILDLNGTWVGTAGDEPFTWTATQSGNSVTGPWTVGEDEVQGTMSGTLSGTALALTLTVPAVPPETCAVTGTGTSPATTNTSIVATVTLVSTDCADPPDSPVVLTLTKVV